MYGAKNSILAFTRPSKSVSKGERTILLGILCHDVIVKAYRGTCFMKDGRFETYNYLNLKTAHLRYQQLDERFTMEAEIKALSTKLCALEKDQINFKISIYESEAAFDTSPPTRPKKNATVMV